MFTKITRNLKQAWNKTIQEFHDFEAEQQNPNQRGRITNTQSTRRSGQTRAKSLSRIATLDTSFEAVGENGTSNLQREKGIKRRRAVTADDINKKVKLKLESSGADVERELRAKIGSLEQELRESKDVIERLRVALADQDDYIRAMEFEMSRISHDGEENASQSASHSVTHNRSDSLESLILKPDMTGRKELKVAHEIVPSRRVREQEQDEKAEVWMEPVRNLADASFERMSPLSMREIDMIVNTTR
ncbi:hypothetical protein V1512DRAFT_266931 [Lipomyces arxii]|uniref:uncharacterized protein n=1 Tax=Lipomyces arxii TaxID=56418 RepID=UPI0034CE9E15